MKQSIGIIGGGLAGLTLAALLGQAGFDVTCIDAEPLARQVESGFDQRTTAISFGSRQVLEDAGVWQALSGNSAAIKTIDILDGNSTKTLKFDAREIDAEAFGWIVDNADLRRSLIKRVQSFSNVRHLTGVSVRDVIFSDTSVAIALSHGESVNVSLVIGADGRKSILRDIMQIGTWGRDYKQNAIVCLVAHERPHNGNAVEHFKPEGPFALLPFTDLPDGTHRSALVWSVHGRDAKKWVGMDEDVFNAALLERSAGRYGKIWLAGKRAAYPLTLAKSYSYIAPRAVLVAEAAHGIHPIAGQGLNMSLRDLAALTDILKQNKSRDIGAVDILKTYQRARRLDNLAMAFATDGLTVLFSNDFLPVTMLRRAGLRMVSRLPFAKAFFMRQAMGLAIKAGNAPYGKNNKSASVHPAE
jgi:2-octaprenyl-6-methoxyphenol hydroxylase